MELLDQLVETRSDNNKLEEEIAHMHVYATKSKQERDNLECKMRGLEVNRYFVNIYVTFFIKE